MGPRGSPRARGQRNSTAGEIVGEEILGDDDGGDRHGVSVMLHVPFASESSDSQLSGWCGADDLWRRGARRGAKKGMNS